MSHKAEQKCLDNLVGHIVVSIERDWKAWNGMYLSLKNLRVQWIKWSLIKKA